MGVRGPAGRAGIQRPTRALPREQRGAGVWEQSGEGDAESEGRPPASRCPGDSLGAWAAPRGSGRPQAPRQLQPLRSPSTAPEAEPSRALGREGHLPGDRCRELRSAPRLACRCPRTSLELTSEQPAASASFPPGMFQHGRAGPQPQPSGVGSRRLTPSCFEPLRLESLLHSSSS